MVLSDLSSQLDGILDEFETFGKVSALNLNLDKCEVIPAAGFQNLVPRDLFLGFVWQGCT